MKKKKLIIVVAILVLLTGCTKSLTDGDKKRVINETTGQNLTANIICLPENDELLAEYTKYEEFMDVKLED